MAGVKGRSGGPRKGAGRKPKSKAPEVAQDAPEIHEAKDMLDMLQKIALGRINATPIQLRAAIAAVQYTHPKKGEGGKKEAKGKAAEAAGGGKFAPASGPRLVALDGKKVAGGRG